MNDEKFKACMMFDDYWNRTAWGKLSIKEATKIIGKYITFQIPNDINKEEVGNKFYESVIEALILKTPLQIAVFNMYEKMKLGSDENKYCRICRTYKKISKPISFHHIGSNFDKDKYKIVFVGKNTWCNSDYDAGNKGYVDARFFGLEYSNKPSTAFGKKMQIVVNMLYPDLSIEEGMQNIAITNMVKCNTTGKENNPNDKTPKEIKDNCIISCGVIQKEIEILKPKRIIFMTGKRIDGTDYDKYIKSFKFGYSECDDGKDIKIDDKNVSWSRTLFNKDRNDFLFMLRVSHPQGKNGDNFVNNIVKWIKLTNEENYPKKIGRLQTLT